MMRAGTENVAYIVAMAAALKENILLLEDTQKKISELESRLMAKLSDSNIDFIRNGDFNHTPGNISLSFRDCDGEAILHRLDLCGVMVSTGSACDSKETQISHVLRAINLPLSYAHGTIRISLCKDNTPDEVDYLVDKLIQIVK
jgi:cysteine desulfurase